MPLKKAEFIPAPILTPLTALMLISAEAISASSLEYIGAPRPMGTPDARSSIIAPQEDPAFLTPSKYFSHNFTEYLSGQKNGFFLICRLFHFDMSQPIIPK